MNEPMKLPLAVLNAVQVAHERGCPTLSLRSACTLFDPVVLTRDGAGVLVAPTVRIDSFCKIEEGRIGHAVVLYEYVHIASFCHLNIGGGLLVMEDGTSAGSGSRIVTGSNKPGPGRGCSAVHPDGVIERSFVHMKK